MNCNCKKELEDKFLARFKASHPEAQDHSAKIKDYCFVMAEGRMMVQGFMEVEQYAALPVKKTGVCRQNNVQTKIFFSYCPFCGVKAGAAP